MLQDLMLRFNLSEAGLVSGDQKNYTRFKQKHIRCKQCTTEQEKCAYFQLWEGTKNMGNSTILLQPITTPLINGIVQAFIDFVLLKTRQGTGLPSPQCYLELKLFKTSMAAVVMAPPPCDVMCDITRSNLPGNQLQVGYGNQQHTWSGLLMVTQLFIVNWWRQIRFRLYKSLSGILIILIKILLGVKASGKSQNL